MSALSALKNQMQLYFLQINLNDCSLFNTMNRLKRNIMRERNNNTRK